MPSLTRVEAEQRADLLRVTNYRIDLDLRPDGPGEQAGPPATFRSTTTILFSATTPGASSFLDVKAAGVQSIELNGALLDVSTVSDGRVELKNLAADNIVVVAAEMAYSTDGEGLHRHVDPEDGETYLYAMSFLDAGPRWFAAFDQPDLKAPFSIDVRCREDWTVIGNGPAVQVSPGHWRISSLQPLSTYFVTLVAGPYHSVYSTHDGIRLGVHARKSLSSYLDAEAADIFGVTTACFDWYHEHFQVRYPFGEYHQAFVPDFNAGAMENPGCVTLREQFVFRSAVTHAQRGLRAVVIAHEMAHQWFGDLVTMRWWDDLWLNESFAEYLGHRACTEATEYPAWVDFGMHRKDWGYIADQAPSTHPVAGNGSTDAASALADFDGISYAKGAAVLKQLASYLGDDVFFSGLQAHFTVYAYDNADFRDLIATWTAAGAPELDGWADQWLRTSGLDTIDADIDEDGITVTVRPSGRIARPHSVQVTGLDSGGQVLFARPTVLGTEPLTIAGGTERPALIVADAADDTWAKIRFGRTPWTNVGDVVGRIAAAQTRVVLYNSIRDAVRDGELDPRAATEIVLHAVQNETDDLVVAALFDYLLKTLAGPYCRPRQRAERRTRIAEVAGALLDRAAPGSDAQLETARAWIAATDSTERLADWLDGEYVPDGLRIDTELRWAVVSRLASIGVLDEDAIGSELDRDHSTAGTVHAARCRALRPDAQAKAAAWRLLIDPSVLSAYEVYATAEGFFVPDQHALTEPYVTRYFDEMPGTASHRSGWALARVAVLAYPGAATTPETVQLAETTLRRKDLDPGLRRALVDGTDQLRRAAESLSRYTAG